MECRTVQKTKQQIQWGLDALVLRLLDCEGCPENLLEG